MTWRKKLTKEGIERQNKKERDRYHRRLTDEVLNYCNEARETR